MTAPTLDNLHPSERQLHGQHPRLDEALVLINDLRAQRNDAGSRLQSPDPLITVRQAANHLGVSPSSIHNYISSHQLPAVRLGRAIRIQPADLADFISAHRENGKDPCPT